MNILPPMMTVWYHFAQKHLGDAVDITIFDCSGKLDASAFPKARVQKFLNFYASTKSDEFLRHVAQNRRIGWICDDDVFFMSHDAMNVLAKEFAVPNTASVSFRHRGWWHFEIEGKRYEASSSYCIAFDRDIVVNKEHLSLAPAEGNTHPAKTGKAVRRYDTGDLANEILLKKGYRCAIVPPEEQSRYIAAFSGMSGAVVLLDHFKTEEGILDYLLSPPLKQWEGNLLFGILSSLLAVKTIQELHHTLTGKEYPLPSLPSRSTLEKIRKDHEPYLRSDQSFAWIDDVSERLRSAL